MNNISLLHIALIYLAVIRSGVEGYQRQKDWLKRKSVSRGSEYPSCTPQRWPHAEFPTSLQAARKW